MQTVGLCSNLLQRVPDFYDFERVRVLLLGQNCVKERREMEKVKKMANLEVFTFYKNPLVEKMRESDLSLYLKSERLQLVCVFE